MTLNKLTFHFVTRGCTGVNTVVDESDITLNPTL